MTKAAIGAEGLRKTFASSEVLKGVSLTVDEGTIHGFVGPSGSGKTTTVRLLTGFYEPSAGTARVLGTDPRLLTTKQRQQIGYMPQLGVLYPHLTIRQNLNFVASLYGVRHARRHINGMLELLDLQDAGRRALRDASGGMQRRVALGAALLHDPRVVFLDEPTSGLDPVLRQRLWDHFTEMRDDGITMFTTTQIVSEATRCDRVALINDGVVVAAGTPEELRREAFGGDVVDVRSTDFVPQAAVNALREHAAVRHVSRDSDDGRTLRVTVAPEEAESDFSHVRQVLTDNDVEIALVERFTAPFDDVFVRLLEST